MSTIRTGSYEDKVELFFRLFDNDGNGVLTFDEIAAMCKLNLSQEMSDFGSLIDDISNYFARLIFDQ